MRKVSVGRLAGLFRGIRVLAALAVAAPVAAAGACADVSVNQDGIPPVLLAIEPAEGPSEGGSLVVITGRDFGDDVIVRFGGERATDVQRVDAETLNVVTPPGVGVVSVSVENPNRMVATLEDAFTYSGAGTGCAVLSTTPSIGAAGVPIVGELRLSYGAPLDVASLEGAVKLRPLGGGDEIPVDVKLDAATDADVIITPKKSLRFWGSYIVTTAEGVLSTGGSACAPAALAFTTIEPEALPRPLRAAPVTGLALVKGALVTASEGYRGFQSFDLADPSKALLKSDLPTSFGPRNVVVHGDRAYAPSGFAGVRILDVSDPLAPKEIGHAGTPGRALDVAVVEKGGKTFLIVADSDGGARVIDVTDPLATLDKGPLDLGDGFRNVSSVDASGERVALAEGTRVFLLDLPDPADLSTQVTHVALDVGAAATDILLDGDRLFVGKSLFGVASWDIASPATPEFIGEAQDPDGPCPSGCAHTASRLVKEGSQLFVAYGRGGVVMYDVLPSGALATVTNFKVPGDVRSIAVTPSRVYAGGEEGVVVFDRAGGSDPLWVDENRHGRARSVRVREGFAYVAAYLDGVQTFSLKDPESPAPVDRDTTPGSLTADEASAGVSSDDGVLAVADGRAGVTLFDLADPQNPALGGTLDTSDAVRAVVSAGNVVYACNDNAGVVAVDANDPKTPVLLGQVPFDDVIGSDACRDLAPAEGVLYVGRTNGLGVLDVTDPKALSWKKLVTLPSKASVSGVRTVGGHLLVTTTRFDYEGFENNTSRLHVFDLADPLSPALIWSSEELGRAGNLAIVGDIAFVAAANKGVSVFDLSDITAPVLEGTIATPGNATFLAAGDGALYVAQGAGGLQAIRTGPLPPQ